VVKKPILYAEDAGNMRFMCKKEDALLVASVSQRKSEVTTGLKTNNICFYFFYLKKSERNK